MQELPRRHRITVEHFYRMGEAGLFAEDERVELINGEVIDVPPMGFRHAGVLDYLARLLTAAVGTRAIVRQQLPVRLGEYSEPLPDISVLKPRDDFYMGRHPAPADVLLIVEVSSSTLRFDQHVKTPLYAHHAIPETWVLDVQGEQVHYHRAPSDGRYTVAGTVPLSGRIEIAAFGVEVDLAPLATHGDPA